MLNFDLDLRAKGGSKAPRKLVNRTPGCFSMGWYKSCTAQGRLQSVQIRTGGDLSHLPGPPGMQVAQPELSWECEGCHRQAGI